VEAVLSAMIDYTCRAAEDTIILRHSMAVQARAQEMQKTGDAGRQMNRRSRNDE
jgi:hypothetical protein